MRLASKIFYLFSSDKELRLRLEHILGFRPGYLSYYQTALIHRSKIEDAEQDNERLEFLGDAILGALVAEYLFKKYPLQPEGFLTELRSRLVRRETLNNVAMRMGLHKLVQYNKNDRGLGSSHIFGNALEALIGAIYLDKGFVKTRKFIIQQIIRKHLDVTQIEQTDTNYKNQLLAWAQKQGHTVRFESMEEKKEGTRKIFMIGVYYNDELVCSGNGYNKKDAGQVAAKKALIQLGVVKDE